MLLLYNRLIHQQDRNVVPHRINAVTLAALQALAAFFLHQRLLADRANQDVEKFLGKHVVILRPLDRFSHPRAPSKEQALKK